MINRSTITISLLALFSLSFSQEIRYLTPPNLSNDNILKKIVCHRPVRVDKPRIEIESINAKTKVIHNYGHGSGGWCMAPGSAKYATELLSEYHKSIDIVIVGAGVIGLYTAYRLIKLGYTNISIIAKDFNNLTSHNAGGLFAYMSSNPDLKIRSFVNNLVIESYKEYAQIARKLHPDFDSGARFMHAYFSSREDSDLESYVNVVMNPAKDVIVDFRNGTRRNLVVYDDCIFMDTIKSMKNLTEFLLKNNVQFAQQEVTDLNTIKASIIFNCLGLAAKQLVPNDADNLSAAQGHLLMLKNQDPLELQYMIELVLNKGKTKSGLDVTRCCYIFPKQFENAAPHEIGVLGGTFIKKADINDQNLEEFDIMLNNAREFFGIKA